jgi:hypothetical protein
VHAPGRYPARYGLIAPGWLTQIHGLVQGIVPEASRVAGPVRAVLSTSISRGDNIVPDSVPPGAATWEAAAGFASASTTLPSSRPSTTSLRRCSIAISPGSASRQGRRAVKATSAEISESGRNVGRCRAINPAPDTESLRGRAAQNMISARRPGDWDIDRQQGRNSVGTCSTRPWRRSSTPCRWRRYR